MSSSDQPSATQGVHQWIVVPSLRWIYDDAEEAHEVGTRSLKALYQFGLHPRERGKPDEAGDLEVKIFGHVLKNRLGTSAGIDKHADIPDPLLALGPSVIEIGGATPYPQDGNPKPRGIVTLHCHGLSSDSDQVFRLPSQNALINRYGLNSEGADHVAKRLQERVRKFAYAHGFGMDELAEQRVLDGEAGVPPGSLIEGKLMAVQVAKNKFTPDEDLEAVKRDYVYCVAALARYADIIVVNVSSPNTPGLRGLQHVDKLTNILTGVVDAAKHAKRKTTPAVMVKVSPDEDTDAQVSGICEAIHNSGCSGVIVGNTTKRRPEPLPAGYSLSDKEAALMLEQGGYSGPQLFERTVALVRKYRTIIDEMSPSNARSTPTSEPHPPQSPPNSDVASQIQETVERDKANLKTPSPEADADSKGQPLIRLPERNSPSSTSPAASIISPATPPASDAAPALSSSSHLDQLPSATETSASSLTSPAEQKIIFATGGITNGRQALEVLEAGASVAMVYTALVYGGVGLVDSWASLPCFSNTESEP
ncbi:MAG: hypothetical protein Q9195_005087 [Heterodermia aff. obscurata]